MAAMNPDGYLETIQPDPAQPAYVASYHDDKGLLASFTTPRGTTGTYTYDALGLLTTDTGDDHREARVMPSTA